MTYMQAFPSLPYLILTSSPPDYSSDQPKALDTKDLTVNIRVSGIAGLLEGSTD